jgi:hypothetical protein
LENFGSVREHLDFVSATVVLRHTKIIGAVRTFEAEII